MFGSLWGLRGEKKEEMDLTPLLTLSRMVFFFSLVFFLPVLGAAVPLGTGSHIKRR